MLILTRRAGESVIIAGDIEIAVLSIKGNQVRLGINAPKGIPVHRQELLTRANPDDAAPVPSHKLTSGT